MLSSLSKGFFAILSAPFLALCLAAASGCEGEVDIDPVEPGVEEPDEVVDE